MNFEKIKRIAVIGCPGSGKTTFCNQFNAKLSYPLHHLDLLYWHGNWQRTPEDIWRIKVQELSQLSTWIIDGNYINTLEPRIVNADLIIFFDYKTWPCIWNSIKRLFLWNNKMNVSYGKKVQLARPSLQQQKKLIQLISKFRKEQRTSIYNLIEKHQKQCVIFKSKKEVKQFLNDHL